MTDANVSERQKKLREQRKSEGLCYRCGKPAVAGKYSCSKCLERDKSCYHFYKSHGICTECHSANAIPNRTRCVDCSMKMDKQNAKYRARITDEQKKAHKEHMRKVYKNRVKNGICYKCGKNPTWNGLKSCYECTLKSREHQKNIRARKCGYKDPDGCCRCGKPCVPGKRVCVKHYEANIKSMEKAKQSENYKLSIAKRRKEIDSVWSEMKWRTQCY